MAGQETNFFGWPQLNYVAGITCLILPHSSAAHPSPGYTGGSRVLPPLTG